MQNFIITTILILLAASCRGSVEPASVASPSNSVGKTVIPQSDIDLAIDFLKFSPEKVRAILADDFHHESPVGKFDNADDFVAHFAANEPPEWSISVTEIMTSGSAIYLDYVLVVPNARFRIIDRLVIRDGLVREGYAYFLDLPPAGNP